MLRWAILVVLLAAVAYTVLLSAPGFGETTAAFGDLQPWSLAVALACQVIVVVAIAQVYRTALLALDEELALSQALNVSMSAFTVTQVLPGGGAFGAVMAARRMYQHGVGAAAATLAVALYGTLSLLTLAMLAAVAVAAALFTSALPPYVVALVGGALAALLTMVVTVVFMVRHRGVAERAFDVAERMLRWLPVDFPALRRSFARVPQTALAPQRLVVVMGWAAVHWLADLASLWVLFRGTGHALGPLPVLAGYGVEHIAIMLPVSPGGLGLVEAGMAGAFTAMGVAGSTSVTAILVYRVVSYWLPLLAGVPQYLRAPDTRPQAQRAEAH